MTFRNCKELQDFIKSGTGLRAVFVDSWEGTIQPPYIVVSKARTDTVKADNKNYAKENRYYVSLFVKKTDTETPNSWKSCLKAMKLSTTPRSTGSTT